jgi:hypothetical protein
MSNNTTTTQPTNNDPPFYKHPAINFIGNNVLNLLILLILLWFNKGGGQEKLESLEDSLLNKRVLDDKIQEFMIRILEIAHADRVLIGQFHNGNVYATGEHYIKFTARYEQVDIGIEPIKKNIRDIEADTLINEVNQLKENNILFIKRESATNNCAEHMNNNNLDQTIEVALKNKQNKIAGIMSIQFLTLTSKNDIDAVENNKERLGTILKYVNSIEKMLNNKTDKKKQTILDKFTKIMGGF